MSNTKKPAVSKSAAAAVETAKSCLVEIAQSVLVKDATQLAVKTAFTKFAKTGVTIGSLKTCAMAQFFRDTLCSMTNPITGKAYSEGTASNYLSAMRSAIKTGKPLDLNKSRSDAKAKSAGQSKTPAKKDKAALVDPNVMEDDDSEMATDEGKTPAVKPGAFKSNDDAIAALKTAIKNVKASCTLKQWEAIQTLYPQIGKLTD